MDDKCPYCTAPVHCVEAGGRATWECTKCDARVGCHPNSTRPLGTLADEDLREARMKVHRAFDPMWQSGRMSRREAYKWLAKRMRLSEDEGHIGMFDRKRCRAALHVCMRAPKNKRQELMEIW